MREYREKFSNLQWWRIRNANAGQKSDRLVYVTRSAHLHSCHGTAGLTFFPLSDVHQASPDHQPSAVKARGSIGRRTAPTFTRSYNHTAGTSPTRTDHARR